MAENTEERRAVNGGLRPVPDPTALTDAAIEKAVASLRDYINSQLQVRDERLRGIDEATKLRLESVVSMPPMIDEKVGRLKDVQDEKFFSIKTQFAERDIRAEREARDNKVAVDAAFAAQKEAAAKQDEANAKAIDKSEKATAETIKTNQELNRLQGDNLTKDVDSLKLAVSRIESVKAGAVENRQTNTDNRGALYATIGLIITIVLFGLALVTFIITQARAVVPT